MRRSPWVVLLLLLPALAGCLGSPQAADSDGDDASDSESLDAVAAPRVPPFVIDLDGEPVAGVPFTAQAVVVQGTDISLVTWTWSVDERTATGQSVEWTLPEGTYTLAATAAIGERQRTEERVVNVLPAPPEDDDGDADGDDGEDAGDGSDGSTSDPEPCTFPDDPILVRGSGSAYTFSYPFACRPDSWEWDLGDGTTSRQAQVAHEYTRDGTVTVTLTILYEGQTLTRIATVTVKEVPLRIHAEVDGDTVTYALGWGRDPTSVLWDFGDGTSSEDVQPEPHVYDAHGPWTVTLTAVAGADEAATTRTFDLQGFPLTILGEVEDGSIDLSFRWGWDAETVAWDFGNGDTDDHPETTAVYVAPGTYTVTLTVDGEGRHDTTQRTLVVTEVPLRVDLVQDRNTVSVKPLWYKTLDNPLWDFGDLRPGSSDAEATHDYRDFGTYTITLTGSSDDGPQSATAEVVVDDIPLVVTETDRTDNLWKAEASWATSPDSVTWDMDGDGEIDRTGDAVEWLFQFKGDYTVTVTATKGTHQAVEVVELTFDQSAPPVWGDPSDAMVRPGSRSSVAGASCTTNFLFHEDWTRFFIGSAAHCVGPTEAPFPCDQLESLPLGTEVKVYDWQDGSKSITTTLAYSSWQSMDALGTTDEATCGGNDFALYEVAPEDVDNIHPAVLHFGGPVSLGAVGPYPEGTELRSYGNSGLRDTGLSVSDYDAAHQTNPKSGWYLDHAGWSHHAMMASPGIPGDSGSGLMTVDGRAIGVLSTLVYAPETGTNYYTDLEKALAWMEQNEGWRPELVTSESWSRDATPQLVQDSGNLLGYDCGLLSLENPVPFVACVADDTFS